LPRSRIAARRLSVGRPRRHELEHLHLALADGLLHGLTDLVEKPGGDARGQDGFAGGGRAPRPQQFVSRCVLEEVAGRPGPIADEPGYQPIG